jgi:hypothetical protein
MSGAPEKRDIQRWRFVHTHYNRLSSGEKVIGSRVLKKSIKKSCVATIFEEKKNHLC